MIDKSKIHGVIFDYGGTIDSNGVHWAEVIWQGYQAVSMPVTREMFREAYVHGERTLGKNPIIKPYHTFRDMLRLKIDIQWDWLKSANETVVDSAKGQIHTVDNTTHGNQFNDIESKHCIVDYCYNYALNAIAKARPVIEWLADKYPLVLVSNFYGNIEAVLKDFGLDRFFPVVIESAVVGVRKPDPQIFRFGVDALQLHTDEVVVIGDSYDKDIVPASTIGCLTIWLKNTGWNKYTGSETADLTISDFAELRNWL
ncbi:MAG: HAD family hydrolase [Tannerella sp.]|jgi:putative hydrolase of the HAD superfamily|nr:HAD family hydrolase [Tannerella sp.]